MQIREAPCAVGACRVCQFELTKLQLIGRPPAFLL